MPVFWVLSASFSRLSASKPVYYGPTPPEEWNSPTCDRASGLEQEKRASHQICEMRRTEFFDESLGLFDREQGMSEASPAPSVYREEAGWNRADLPVGTARFF